MHSYQHLAECRHGWRPVGSHQELSDGGQQLRAHRLFRGSVESEIIFFKSGVVRQVGPGRFDVIARGLGKSGTAVLHPTHRLIKPFGLE